MSARAMPLVPVPWRVRSSLAASLAVARGHPRHLMLVAVVAGMLAAPAGGGAVLAVAALALAVAGRPGLGILLSIAVLAGAGVAQLRTAALDAGRLASLDGQHLRARALLLEPLHDRGYGQAVARARLVGGLAAGEQVVLRVATRRLQGGRPGIGDELEVAGEVTPLGRWDGYQARRGAHAALETDVLRPTGHHRGGVAGALDAARRRSELALADQLARPEAALLRGMILGEDERLADQVREDFQRSGLAHVLAVSGQNVMLLATLVLAVGAATGLPLRLRFAVALVLVTLYVPLAGAGPSIQRAGVMGAAGLVAALAGRPASRWYGLVLAALVTLVLNPRASGEPGWQLSFAAVAALLLLAPALRSALERRLPPSLADVTAITIAATLGTAPLMAMHFEQVSLAALPANVLAAPAIAPIMWLGMLAAGVGQVDPTLATPFTALAAPLLVALQWLAHTAAHLPLASVSVRFAAPGLLVAIYAGMGALVLGARALLRSRGGGLVGRLGLASVGVAALAAVAVLRVGHRGPLPPAPGELVVSFQTQLLARWRPSTGHEWRPAGVGRLRASVADGGP